MNLSAPFDAILQILSAVLIFVTSYLALVLCVIVCLVVAELAADRARIVRAYGVKPVALTDGVPSRTRHMNRKPHHFLPPGTWKMHF